MNVKQLASCCGVAEITELREHPTPEEAMKVFVEQHKKWDDDTIGDIPLQVIFNGVEKFTTLDKPPSRDEPHFRWNNGVFDKKYWESSLNEHEKNQRCGYASRFAAFIKKNRLGTIISPRGRPNVNHKNHIIKVYIWHPDEKRLKAWYKARNA